MSYTIIGFVLLAAAVLGWWALTFRQKAAEQVKLRKKQSDQRARMARQKLDGDAGEPARTASPKRAFGQR